MKTNDNLKTGNHEAENENDFAELSKVIEKYKKRLYWAGGGLLLAYVVLQLLRSSSYGFGVLGKFSPEKLGQLGDYIGGILNPLVAFFALMALFQTTQLQAKLTKQQIADERQRTKDANDRAKKLEREKQEQEKQVNFMKMYEAYVRTLNDCRGNRKTVSGRHYTASGRMFLGIITKHNIIKRLCDLPSLTVMDKNPNVIYHYNSSPKSLLPYNSNPQDWASLFRGIENYFSESPFLMLAPVFRMSFHLLKRELAQEGFQKYDNIRFFRAQLTESELILLAINVLFNDEGRKGLAVVAAKSGLFKHLKAKNLERLIKREFPDTQAGFFDIKLTEEVLKEQPFIFKKADK
jgi:hypothetical protein